MSRTQTIERTRAELTELMGKWGESSLKFEDAQGASLLEQAKEMKLVRTMLTPPKLVIPCAAEIEGMGKMGKMDPCLVVPTSLPLELLPDHQGVAVARQVRSISRSLYTMSPYMMDESARFQGFYAGRPMPMLVSIGGSYKYLVNQKSFFFQCDEFVGSDIDQLSPMEPDTLSLKLNRYHQGNDLTDKLLLIVADY